ncbi:MULTISPECIES: hypothetical protein [Chryseobacterium]|uniref:Uncharacterized protein n=1 Tax=Chryseobacterium camelliae TaxID=1265445 RepID=A0ABU0TFT3_9FLAO|nr:MULTISPECIES: hypothetical protein [Chryseobacterium]MDT3406374.1 hypothetical protein [Pseudacidovorax intermedius]MDQ1095826.1 hypothetical protein [Chryseobacterium camelliae]MDQ1099763.1 hypothetical protein [Chryseobacterium sp. SORGH_AS_1048]MDR6087111.1 hypothetical protein [Chryseobacterium sp. SORGH_AS_0909]MDR6131484.1 hypothetical protein [Chryseobacterium sp. SORGH_AS_1175]
MKSISILFFCLCCTLGFAQAKVDVKNQIAKVGSAENKYIGKDFKILLSDLNDYIRSYKLNMTDIHAFIILYFDDQETYFEKRAGDKTPSLITVYFDTEEASANEAFKLLAKKEIEDYSDHCLKDFGGLKIKELNVFIEK